MHQSYILYKDIDLSLEKQDNGDIPIITDIDSIKASIFNQLFIGDKENFFEDGFGYSIKGLLQEPGDDITSTAIEAIFENLLQNDDRISSISEINITFDYKNLEYTVNIKVKLENVIEPQEINLILKKTR